MRAAIVHSQKPASVDNERTEAVKAVLTVAPANACPAACSVSVSTAGDDNHGLLLSRLTHGIAKCFGIVHQCQSCVDPSSARDDYSNWPVTAFRDVLGCIILALQDAEDKRSARLVCRAWRRAVDSNILELQFADPSCGALDNWAPLSGCKDTATRLHFHGTVFSHIPASFSTMTNIRELDLSSSCITRLPEKSLWLANVHKLVWSRSGLTEVPSSLAGLKQLTDLDLSYNQLDSIALLFLQNITALHHLNVSCNPVSETDWLSSSCPRMPRLQTLVLSHQDISTLTPDIGLLTTLTRLELENTLLQHLPDSFSNLSNLAELNIQQCKKLVALPMALSSCTRLATLRLEGCRSVTLSSLKEALDGLWSLTALRCDQVYARLLLSDASSANSLANLQSLSASLAFRPSSMPELVTNLVHLTQLTWATFEVCGVHSGIGVLTALRSLSLDSNYLKRLPDSLCCLTGLTFLDVANNRLRRLPAGVTQLIALETVNLAENNLRELPLGFTALSRLASLNVAHNVELTLDRMRCLGSLTSLTHLEIGRHYWHTGKEPVPPGALDTLASCLPRLTTLGLKGHCLLQLPSSFLELTALRWINLTSTKLTVLPPVLCDMTGLLDLNLTMNKLSSLPPEVTRLGRLKSLSLKANCFWKFPVPLCGLTTLQSLDLAANRLLHLPRAISSLTNLLCLRLEANHIRRLPLALTTLGSLHELSIEEPRLRSLPKDTPWRMPHLVVQQVESTSRWWLATCTKPYLAFDQERPVGWAARAWEWRLYLTHPADECDEYARRKLVTDVPRRFWDYFEPETELEDEDEFPPSVQELLDAHEDSDTGSENLEV